ncbi:MAG: TolC family protein [Bacteroidales bacterium]|nr:TolC family protein [Bacteroidales bacterium]
MKAIYKHTILLIMVHLFLSGIIQGQTLNEYLKEAGENHPELQAAYHEYHAALEKVPQVGALPDPKLGFGYFISPIETRLGPQQLKISVSQMFPWFGTLKEQEKAAAEKARIQYQQFVNLKNQIYQEVKSQWYELYKTQQALHIIKENLGILNSLKNLSRRNYETGKSQMADVLRTEVNIREQKNKLEDLKEKLSTQKTEFNLLLNRSESDSIRVPGNIQPDTFDTMAYRDSIRNNPGLTALSHKKTALEHQYEADRKKGYPNLSLGLDYAIIGKRQDMQVNNSGRDVVMPMVGISLPLNRKKYDAMKKETSLKLQAVQSEQQDRLNTLSARYKKAEEKYLDAIRKVDLYKKQIEETEKIYRLLKTNYSTDGENFFELLRTQLMVQEYKLKLRQAIANQNIAVSKLEYLTNQNQTQ